MKTEEIKNLVSLDSYYRLTTISGETFIGIIDGPYKGYEKAKLEDYRKDYLYVTLLNNQQQTIRIHCENIEIIEEF